jgi:hypothetical protein
MAVSSHLPRPRLVLAEPPLPDAWEVIGRIGNTGSPR